MVMYGSGAVIDIMRVIIPKVPAMIPRSHLPANIVFFAADPDTTNRGSAVQRTATGPRRATGSVSPGFVLFWT